MDAMTTTEVRGALTLSDRVRVGREAVRVFPLLAQRRRARMWKLVPAALAVGLMLGAAGVAADLPLFVPLALIVSFGIGWWVATVSLIRGMPQAVVQQFDGQRALSWCGPGVYAAVEWAHVDVALTPSGLLAVVDRYVVLHVPTRLCAAGQAELIVRLAAAGGATVRQA